MDACTAHPCLRPLPKVPPKLPRDCGSGLLLKENNMLFTRYVIPDQERGLLVRNGRLVQWLEPGRHRVFQGLSTLELRRFNRDTFQTLFSPELKAVAPDGAAVEAFVPEAHVGLLRADGVPKAVLQPGRYLLWQLAAKVTLEVVDLAPLRPGVPEGFWALVPPVQLQTVLVLPFERALIHADGLLSEVLSEGRAAFSTLNRKLEVTRVDLREQEVQILAQELMTRDKVTLRLNLVVKYRVTDPVKAVQTVTVLRDALYTEAQMSARHFVAELNLDQLLERRSEAVAPMIEALRERAATWGVEVLKLDVKDLVLPGEMKLLLNQVIEAEKKAAAQVIYRREEVASTRSMANTAQMLDRNPALLRLKELEAYKEIATAIPNLTLVLGSPDMLRTFGGTPKG